MEAPLTSEERLGDQSKSLKDMETSINVGNNRLAAPGGINRQTAPLDCSVGEDSFFTLLPLVFQSTPDLKWL